MTTFTPTPAPPMSAVDAGDTAYVILVRDLLSFATPINPVYCNTEFQYLSQCGALVLLMTPGLGLFYGGMVSSKNVRYLRHCIIIFYLDLKKKI